MTFEDLKALDREWLTAKEVAELLSIDAQALRYMARMKPEMLGFPVICYQCEGAQTWHCKIPRRGLISYLEHGRPYILTDGKWAGGC